MPAERTGQNAVQGKAGFTELDLGGITVSILIKRHAQARRVSLRLGADGEHFVLVVPTRASAMAALSFARGQAGWMQERLARRPPRVPFNDGAEIPYQGIPHRLVHCPDGRGGVWVEGDNIRVSGDPAFFSRRVGDWLKRRARDELADHVSRMGDLLGRRAVLVSVGDPVSRWGSCSSSGRLAFSWRLILAPVPVLVYVAAHEVAHLVEMNHSPAFWSVVERLVPEPKRSRQWLKENGARLRRYG